MEASHKGWSAGERLHITGKAALHKDGCISQRRLHFAGMGALDARQVSGSVET
jgi:hypothetical protein